MDTDGVDELDHQPVWRCVPGETELGGCIAVERLGTGHRTETWLAWSRELWCPVVLKLARPAQVRHPRARATLRREVVALEDMSHPALPRLVAARLDHEVPHVLTEYVDGPTLDVIVDDHGALPARDAALLGAQLLPALAVVHARGIAHLDVKPENVVLRDGRPVLIDFGSSRRLGSRQPAGRPVGTLGYAAPEMEACAPVSVAMDLFGLGTVLAEAVTGLPFSEGPVRLPRSRVGLLARRLLDPDPARRGGVPEVLTELAAACGTRRPWPAWLDPRDATVRAG
jgi:eukaryotic-like serine/threonine-protein kinase